MAGVIGGARAGSEMKDVGSSGGLVGDTGGAASVFIGTGRGIRPGGGGAPQRVSS